MQNLVVQALTMRQLGRLRPSHLLAAGYGLRQTKWCPRSIHTRQLRGCTAFPTLGFRERHRTTPHGRDSVMSWSVHHLRFKSSRKKGAARTIQQEEEEEEEEEEKDPQGSDYEDEVEEDSDQPKDYKDIEKYVQSFRYDVILRAGLDMAHKKIEDAFYSNKLRLNGKTLIKKSKTVTVGDTLDMVLSETPEENTVTLMRVTIRRVLGEVSKSEKNKVALRRWKSVKLPKSEVFKS